MNKLQKIQFDLLEIFVDICNANQLTYFLVCGTALGAVKYSGFIPWDDDVDVALPRKDYKRFCEIAPEYLPTYVFLQNHITDIGYSQIFSKLRDSRTTFIEKTVAQCDINHGVYIDIFPLDGYPQNEREALKLERKKRILSLKRDCVYDLPDASINAKALMTVERMIGCHNRVGKTVAELSALLSQYPYENSKIVCNHGNWQGKLEYAPKEQYGNGLWAEFEGLKVRIPEKYNEYLTQKYGDWRSDIPDEEKEGHHYCIVCDTSRPYTDYVRKLPNGKLAVKPVEQSLDFNKCEKEKQNDTQKKIC